MAKKTETSLPVSKTKIHLSVSDRIYYVILMTILVIFCLIIIYPLYHMVIVSISDGYAVLRGEVTLIPKGITLKAYEHVLSDPYIPMSYRNTIIYTLCGTLVNLFMTTICAYPLSRKTLPGRYAITMFIIFTMFFDAGLVSNFLVVNSLHLRDTLWAIILPPAINVWYMIIMRTFFSGIPQEMHESAYIDGANDLTIFFRIILPLSKAVIATMVLFYAVWHWNSFLYPLIYLDDRMKYPMQLILRNIVLGADAGVYTSGVAADAGVMGLNVKYSVVFVTVLPILIVYPFVQKYFVKGVMIGSVKG